MSINNLLDIELLRYQIALTLVKGIGSKIARQIINNFGSEKVFFKQQPSILKKSFSIPDSIIKQLSKPELLHRADEEILFIEKNSIQPVHISSPDYPQRLTGCEDAPTLLYSKGVIDYNRTKIISIVGTRNASEEGKSNCERLIESISNYYPDVIVVSGLAYGVDICAHNASLKHSLVTVAVVGHGLDRIYPNVHRQAALEMMKNGSVLTEFLSKTEPERQNFVKRNRIIAGMSDATIVIESAEKGGALITAQIAGSYNRDVLAFPGRVTDEGSRGCNWLIKKNMAALIENIADLEYVLGWEKSSENKVDVQANLFRSFKSANEELIYNILIKEREININQLCFKTQVPINIASTILLSFEFDGIVKSIPGNKYRLI